MKNIKGQSLFEVILALFIITLIIVAVVILSTNSISNSLLSRNKSLASKYTQEAVEWLRKQKQIDFTLFKNNITSNPTTYCLTAALNWNLSGNCSLLDNSENIGTTIFRREVSLTSELDGGKPLITANVVTFWDDSKGRHEARTVTYFTDTRDQ
jgi:hypothetical protein